VLLVLQHGVVAGESSAENLAEDDALRMRLMGHAFTCVHTAVPNPGSPSTYTAQSIVLEDRGVDALFNVSISIADTLLGQVQRHVVLILLD
jgi:hypothetical protein